MSCERCGDLWSISTGPGRIVGAIARNVNGVSAPLPDDFAFEYCACCKKRNMTPELEQRFLAVEAAYLASFKKEGASE